LWPAQREVAEKFQANRLVVCLKARQLGLTWLALAFGLWKVLLHDIATVLLFSRRDNEAVDLLFRMREMSRRIPLWLQPGPALVDNDHEWQLTNGSRVLAFPTTAPGDSYTASLVIIDEGDLIENLDQVLAAVKPTIDAKGSLIMVSRANKATPESCFKRTYRAARAGGSDWVPIFLPWNARPDRTPEWYEAQKKDIKDRTGSLDDLHEQYPATDAEALAARSQDKRLPADWILGCYEPAVALPLEKVGPALPGLTIFDVAKAGRRYVGGADPSEGGPDESALTILDVESGAEVAFLAGRFEPSTFAAHIGEVSRWYGGCPVLVERNAVGHAVLLWLKDNTTWLRRLCGHDGLPGWHTTSKSKAIMYATAGEVLRDGEATIRAIETFHQLGSIEGATLRAPEGQHDDRAVSFVLALQGRAQLLKAGTVEQGPCILTPGRTDPFGGLADFPLPGPRPQTGALGYGAEGDPRAWVDASGFDDLNPWQGWVPSPPLPRKEADP
jgi:hypothetical protein